MDGKHTVIAWLCGGIVRKTFHFDCKCFKLGVNILHPRIMVHVRGACRVNVLIFKNAEVLVEMKYECESLCS